MNPFRYIEAETPHEAVSLATTLPGAQFIAGGTSQVDLMKEGVQRPAALVSLRRLGMDTIAQTADSGLRVGANVRNARLADHPVIQHQYTAIAEALHAGASQQIRNMATTAGNLLQRTRCPYLRDAAQRCNKRQPGSGCAAREGFNRLHAIFGQTDRGADDPATCIAVHPSDMAVAMAVHEAVIVVRNGYGESRLPFEDLHRLPGEDPHIDSNLGSSDLIVAVELPPFRGTSHYLKVRDRASFAYALVSCAVAVELQENRISTAKIALGSVAAKPWRVPAAEAVLQNAVPHMDIFQHAAEVALRDAQTYAMNAYKPAMARAFIERALSEVTGLRPLAGPPGTAFAASVGGVAGSAEPATSTSEVNP